MDRTRLYPIGNPGKILIVKPSSLGDIVHSLPFLHSLKTCIPGAGIDWVVASGFEGLLEGHPMIHRLWIINKDAWKKIGYVKNTVMEIKKLFEELKREKYSLVVDLQGLLRSGIITKATGAPLRVGFKEAREGSRFFYTHKVEGGRDIHAVDRYLKIATFLGCDISQVSFPFPDFAADSINMSSQLSFSQAKRVGNPSENEERFRTSRNDRLLTEAGFINDLLDNSSSSSMPHPPAFDIREGYAVIVPGARWKTKRWSPEKFGELASLLPVRTVVVGGKGDMEISDKVASLSGGKAAGLAGKTSLKQLVEVMRGAKFVVSNDSGPMHIAAALGVPVFAIFGPTDPKKTGPYGQGHTIIRADAHCAPCFRRTCDDMKCMRNLSAERVYEAIMQKLYK